MQRLVVFVLFLHACGLEDTSEMLLPEDVGGGVRMAVHVPVPAGHTIRCTQGAGGTFITAGIPSAH